MIKIKEVTLGFPRVKRYRDYILHPFRGRETKDAVKNVNLSIAKRDHIAILGENGAGKTTLLKLIGGLLYPTKGSIFINDYDTCKDNLKVRKIVGYVLNEDRSFYWRLTGKQNLSFFGALDNLYGKRLHNRIHLLMSMVGLEHCMNDPVRNYSSGMRQRLAIARGLLANPECLILDEPTRTLDPLGAENIRNIILNNICATNVKTLIVATHQITEAEVLCNKVCVMKKGSLIAFEEIESLKDSYTDGLNEYYKNVMSKVE